MEKKKNKPLSPSVLRQHPWGFSAILLLCLPTRALVSRQWGWVQAQIRQQELETSTTVGRGREDPRTLEGHSQSQDPEGVKHSKCRSLLHRATPEHSCVCNNPARVSCLALQGHGGVRWTLERSQPTPGGLPPEWSRTTPCRSNTQR